MSNDTLTVEDFMLQQLNSFLKTVHKSIIPSAINGGGYFLYSIIHHIMGLKTTGDGGFFRVLKEIR